MTPPRRPVGRPPYNPRKACAAMRGVGDAAPYKVRRAVGAGHARPAASRNHPFTVDPQGRIHPSRAVCLRRPNKNRARLFALRGHFAY